MLGLLVPGLGFYSRAPVEDHLPALPIILLHVFIYLGFHFLVLMNHVFILLT